MADHDEGMWAAMMDQHASHGMMTEDSFEHPTIPRWFKIVGLVIGLIVFVMILGPLITFLLSFVGLGSGVLNAFAAAINALAQYLPWILGLLTAAPFFDAALETYKTGYARDEQIDKAVKEGDLTKGQADKLAKVNRLARKSSWRDWLTKSAADMVTDALDEKSSNQELQEYVDKLTNEPPEGEDKVGENDLKKYCR